MAKKGRWREDNEERRPQVTWQETRKHFGGKKKLSRAVPRLSLTCTGEVPLHPPPLRRLKP